MIPNHSKRLYSGIVLERIENLPPGGKMGDLPEHLQHKSFIRMGAKKTGGPNLRLLRLEYDKPSLTITAYIFNKFVHPTENRYITPREAACLQDFPLYYEFKGTLGEVQKQIGNAIPVKLAKALAGAVANYFEKKNMTGQINIASYFTGAGGFDLGFEQASNEKINFKTRFTTDIEKSVEETIKVNRPEWNFLKGDIRELPPETIRDCIGKNPDVIIGGPPCQPFSVAGKQEAIQNPLGELYRDYVRHIANLQPSIVLMENVYGLAQVKSIDMIKEIYKSFNAIGYKITHKELLAADFGTPQKRRRLFFVAAKDLHNFEFPEPTHCEFPNLLGLPTYESVGNTFSKL